MNTRIQELAAQAKAAVPQGILGVDKWIEAYNEQFATLIIKECAQQIDVYKMMKLDSSFYSGMLREHFGVK